MQSILSLLVFLPTVLLAQPAPQPIRTDYNMQEIGRPSKLSNAELSGRTQFAKYCALCHDPVTQPTPAVYGPPLNSELIESLGDDFVRKRLVSLHECEPVHKWIDTRPMRAERSVQLSQPELHDRSAICGR